MAIALPLVPTCATASYQQDAGGIDDFDASNYAGCPEHSTLGLTQQGQACICEPGYVEGEEDEDGDSHHCVEFNGCASEPCAADVTCTDLPPPSMGFQCGQCPPGFNDATGNGTVCIDIDECARELDNCSAIAVCVNERGSYDCQCPPGYEGHPTTECRDIDECATATANCGLHSDCINEVGSFRCECAPGYQGNPTQGCEVASSESDFGTPYVVHSVEPSYGPAMTISESGANGVVYHLAHYRRFGPVDEQRVYYLRSSLSGRDGTWSNAIALNDSISANSTEQTAVDVTIAAHGDWVVVAWQQQRRIYLTASSNAGETFDTPTEVSQGMATFRRLPQVAIDADGRVHLVWSEAGAIQYSTLDLVAESSWPPPQTVFPAFALHPAIAATDTHVFVAAQRLHPSNDNIVIRNKPRNANISWSGSAAPKTVHSLSNGSFGTAAFHAHMNFAVDRAQNVILVFTENLATGPNDQPTDGVFLSTWGNPILASARRADGSGFVTPFRIAERDSGGYLPQIAVHHNPVTNTDELFTLWQQNPFQPAEQSGQRAVLFRRATIPGAEQDQWQAPEIENRPSGISAAITNIHFGALWSEVDFFLGRPGLVSHAGRATAYWVQNERIYLSQKCAPGCD